MNTTTPERNTGNGPEIPSVKNILLPVDILHGKTDTMLYLQSLAAEAPLMATLLYVIELNIEQPDPRLYDELAREAHLILGRLTRKFLGHEMAAALRVRVGRADEEILDEARERQSNLIVMSSPKPRTWRNPFRSRTAERVVQSAPCPTVILPLHWAGAPRSIPQEIQSMALRPTWVTAFG